MLSRQDDGSVRPTALDIFYATTDGRCVSCSVLPCGKPCILVCTAGCAPRIHFPYIQRRPDMLPISISRKQFPKRICAVITAFSKPRGIAVRVPPRCMLLLPSPLLSLWCLCLCLPLASESIIFASPVCCFNSSYVFVCLQPLCCTLSCFPLSLVAFRAR